MLLFEFSFLCLSAVILLASGKHSSDGKSTGSTDDTCSGLACNMEILKRLVNLEMDEKCFRSAAFYVRVDLAADFTIAKGEKVPYNTPVLIGNTLFDVQGRVFEAPYPGLYAFAATACTRKNKAGLLDMKHDNTLIAILRLGDENFRDCNSVFALAHLAKGDKVWMERSTLMGNSVPSQESGGFDITYWNSFAGVLISPDCNDGDK